MCFLGFPLSLRPKFVFPALRNGTFPLRTVLHSGKGYQAMLAWRFHSRVFSCAHARERAGRGGGTGPTAARGWCPPARARQPAAAERGAPPPPAHALRWADFWVGLCNRADTAEKSLPLSLRPKPFLQHPQWTHAFWGVTLVNFVLSIYDPAKVRLIHDIACKTSLELRFLVPIGLFGKSFRNRSDKDTRQTTAAILAPAPPRAHAIPATLSLVGGLQD